MEKLIHQFEFGLFFGKCIICWINFLIEKFAWKPILDAVNDREGIKTHYFLLKMQENANLNLTINVFYKKQEWSVTTC
jgi:F-type H+-transporting ATPase subunit b